jgi:hypothetical protein
MFRHCVSGYAVVNPVSAEAFGTVMAEAAHAAGIRVFDWIESCADRVALVARNGMGIAGTMAVATAGSVLRVMGGKPPIGHNIISCGGCLPDGAFVATDAGR